MSAFVTAKEIRELGVTVPEAIPDDALGFRHRLRPIYGSLHDDGTVLFDCPFYLTEKRKRLDCSVLLPEGLTIPESFWDPTTHQATDADRALHEQVEMFERVPIPTLTRENPLINFVAMLESGQWSAPFEPPIELKDKKDGKVLYLARRMKRTSETSILVEEPGGNVWELLGVSFSAIQTDIADVASREIEFKRVVAKD